MVRNNRRKAFTIVEIVIVIAVIAILAAVMIPTFSGIIKRANISADVQLSASINTQLSIYKAEGNKIETEADLINALKSDFDFIANLNPKSAKHGYHYWYNAAENKVEVLTYAEVLAKQSQATMSAKPVYLAAGDEADEAAVKPETFAHASPRTVVPGFYLLDQKNGEGENVIAEFFAAIEGMSTSETASDDYTNAINELTAISQSEKNDNKDLAVAILAKIRATAIITDKGAHINVGNDSNIKVSHIYIPANNNENKDNYYLNHTIINAGDKTVDNLLDVTDTENSTIELPENIKVAEGSLNGFANVTIKVDTDNPADLSTIFSADSVSPDATIVLNDGSTYQINGTVILDKAGNEVDTLAYKNPAASIDVSATTDSNIVIKSQTNYIALDKIMNKAEGQGIKLNLVATPKDSKGDPAYATVTWSTVTAGVYIDEANGTVTFADSFNADTAVFKAVAKSTITLGDGTVETKDIEKTFTATVVRVTSATIDFVSGVNTGSQLLISNGNNELNPFVVAYDGEGTSANLAASSFKYGNNLVFSADEIKTLGITTPTVAFTTEGSYFTVNADKTFTFNHSTVKTLLGSITKQSVGVTVSDNAGAAFTATINITVNDNTDVPFVCEIPSYKNGYVYTVGNGNAIKLGEFFAEKAGIQDISDYSVYVYNRGPSEGFFYNPIEGMTIENPTADSVLNFTGRTGRHWIALTTANGSADEETAIYIEVEVVNGKNFTDEDNLTNLTQNNGSFTYATYDSSYNIVLHDDIDIDNTLASRPDVKGKPVIFLNNTALYGNYFTISAKNYLDVKQEGQNGTKGKTLMMDGHSLLEMRGTSSLNQVIIDGPLYSNYAQATDLDGEFCFGILCWNTTKITDSYIYGFMSPIRVRTGTLELKNSVLEAGTWANLFVYDATKITLDNSMTIQDYFGYTPTVGSQSNKIIGLGIYIHDEMAGKNIEIVFKGDTKQINWFGEDADDRFGGYADTAKIMVFEKKDGEYVFKDFMHTYGGTNFVNAGIAWQAGTASGSSNFTHPTVNFVSTDWTINGEKANITYARKDHYVKIWFIQTATQIHSSVHVTGSCDSCGMLNADMVNAETKLSFGADWFYDTRVNPAQ